MLPGVWLERPPVKSRLGARYLGHCERGARADASNGQLGVGPPPAESIKADISPMLLNELKQQAAEIRELRAEVQALQASQHN